MNVAQLMGILAKKNPKSEVVLESGRGYDKFIVGVAGGREEKEPVFVTVVSELPKSK